MAAPPSTSSSSGSASRPPAPPAAAVDAPAPAPAPIVYAPAPPLPAAPLFQPLAPITLRLDRDNYPYWRSQVLPAIRAHDLEGFLLGTRPCPAKYLDDYQDPASHAFAGDPLQVNPLYTQWIRTDQAILSWLLNSISETMLGHVLRCVFSQELWFLLENLFTTQSRARVLQLRFQLQSLKKGSLSIHEYVLKMKALADALTSAGQVFSDDDLILYILGGLGPEYDSVVINLTSRGDHISLSEAQFLLQSQEMRIEQQNSANQSTDFTIPSANLAARGRRGSPSPSAGRFPPSRARGRGRGRSAFGRVICQICNKQGHPAAKCYHRFDMTFSLPSAASGSAQSPQLNQQALFANSTSSPRPDDSNWYMDSGATNHITDTAANIQAPSEYGGKQCLQVGHSFEEGAPSREG